MSSFLLVPENIPAAVLECETDADCIDEANCSDGLCQCPDGYVFSLNGYQCLKRKVLYENDFL